MDMGVWILYAASPTRPHTLTRWQAPGRVRNRVRSQIYQLKTCRYAARRPTPITRKGRRWAMLSEWEPPGPSLSQRQDDTNERMVAEPHHTVTLSAFLCFTRVPLGERTAAQTHMAHPAEKTLGAYQPEGGRSLFLGARVVVVRVCAWWCPIVPVPGRAKAQRGVFWANHGQWRLLARNATRHHIAGTTL